MTSLPISTNHRPVCCTMSTDPAPILLADQSEGVGTEEPRRVSLAVRIGSRSEEQTSIFKGSFLT